MLPFIFVLVIGLTVLFLLGPKLQIDTTTQSVELPEDLDGYLKASESQFADLVPNTEKKIIWADPAAKTKTPVAIVYLHGFSATRQEAAPLPDIVAQRLGANLFYTRLTGHGRGSGPMGAATAHEWFNDTVEALEIGKRIGEKIIIMGTSTGGTLGTWVAVYKSMPEILAYVFVSPNFMPNNPIAPFMNLPWAKLLITKFFRDTHTWEPSNERHGLYWTTKHSMDVVFEMIALVNLVIKSDLSQIQTPLLLFLSKQDQVVNPQETEKIFERFGSLNKKKVYLDNDQDPMHHVIVGDILSPNTIEPAVQTIVEFVEPLLPKV